MLTCQPAIARPRVASGESLQRLAHWLRRNSNEHLSVGHMERQQLAARYPAELLSRAELDALLAVACS